LTGSPPACSQLTYLKVMVCNMVGFFLNLAH
jgi:hypothetical protein